MNLHVLMVCGTFPPQEQVGGLRPAMFAKYLPLFGWIPIILTRTYPFGDSNHRPTLTGIEGLPSDSNIVGVEMATGTECIGRNDLLAKIRRFFMPEYGQSWDLIDGMIEKFLESGHAAKIDVIYATTPDFGQITVGIALSARLGVPIIVDHRDIIEQDVHIGLRARLLYLRHIARRFWVTRNAFHAIAISSEQKNILTNRISNPVSVIVNGYDEQMFRASPGTKTDLFTINYVGRILGQWLRDPSVFFEALDLLKMDPEVGCNDIAVRFIGCEIEILKPILQGHICSDWIDFTPRIEYAAVPDVISQSCINLVLTNQGRTGVLTTKFFEYLAVRRPILCVPHDDGALANLIDKTKSGLASSDECEVARFIKQHYLQWKKSGGTAPLVDSIGVEQFSRSNGAKQLAALLDQAAKTKTRPLKETRDGCYS